METRFVTPAQTLQEYKDTRRPYPLIADSSTSATPEMYDTLHPHGTALGKAGSYLTDELAVSWIGFLQALHDMQTGPPVAGSGRHCCAEPTSMRHGHGGR